MPTIPASEALATHTPRPNSSDPKFHIWDEEDSTIMSWLWNSMVLEISGTCVFLTSAKEIWDVVNETYSKMMCSEDAALLKRFVEKERIFEFLASLNVEYDHKRSQVLGRDQLPSLNETISMIQAEEGRFPTTGMARQICPKQTTKIFTGVITVKKPGHEKNRNSKGEQQSNQEQAHLFTTQPGSGLRQDDWTCKRKGWVVVP
ncbi:hypothetical protein CK203_114378 [Vitis vinifera]|uniref:Retrotransposon Copia-like N-terminal domain-containing protein n=1 Tax=Vitis vinifera TaxID=29760 RepID=A0A438FEL9_VITVI|nr:hypothetical protein CK203_114378 [Vitis vinifera]